MDSWDCVVIILGIVAFVCFMLAAIKVINLRKAEREHQYQNR